MLASSAPAARSRAATAQSASRRLGALPRGDGPDAATAGALPRTCGAGAPAPVVGQHLAVRPVQGRERRPAAGAGSPAGRPPLPATRSARRARATTSRPVPRRGRPGVGRRRRARAVGRGRRRSGRPASQPAAASAPPRAPAERRTAGGGDGRATGHGADPIAAARGTRRPRDLRQRTARQPLSWRFFNFTRRSRTREQAPARTPPGTGSRRNSPAPCVRSGSTSRPSRSPRPASAGSCGSPSTRTAASPSTTSPTRPARSPACSTSPT